jgi:hypothetical protein
MTTSQLGKNAAEELQQSVTKLTMFCSQLISYFVCSAQDGDEDRSVGKKNAAE